MKMNELLKTELGAIRPSESEEEKIREMVGEFIDKLNKNLRKINAEAVVGGSFAKGTTIKKKRYDVDVFVLFKDDDKASDRLEKALKAMKIKFSRLPGSRDYFSLSMKTEGMDFKTEIVPVFKIKKAEEARNVTDVSMLHVNYVKSSVRKNQRLADDIRMAKAFCYAQNCYGAESHIKGFSGYCLEILTIHHKGFLNLLKKASKWGEKEVIDPARFYKNKNEIMSEINEAKLSSPLVLIDPVQRNRNAAAALDKEKYSLFIDSARRFLKKPSKEFFELKEFELESFKKEAKRKKMALFEVGARSDKAKEDISGAKLLKMHNVILGIFKKEGYELKDKWVFSGNSSNSYFMTRKPSELLQKGPPVERRKHAEEFKRRWVKVFVRNGNLYTKRKPKEEKDILNLHKKLLKDMDIDSYKVRKLI